MSGIAASSAGFGRSLADQLLDVAGSMNRAAHFADGEYIPQMSRQMELTTSFKDSTRAGDALDELLPQIAVLEGGEDGLRLAKQALDHLAEGRSALREGVAVEDDVLRGGTVVEDAIAVGSAGALFREAESKVRGLVDIARIEQMTPDEVFAGLLNRP